MGLKDKIRKAMRSFLEVEDINELTLRITDALDFEANAIKNRIWYEGDANELLQLYDELRGQRSIDRFKFWGAACTKGMEIQKRHTGLPGLIVDTLADITMADFNGFEFDNDLLGDYWNSIADENSFTDLVEDMIKDFLVIGDGAFKVSIDPEITDKPIIEWWPGDKVDVERKRGRIREIVFRSTYTEDHKTYTLFETYGYGYVTYELKKGDVVVPIETVPQLESLKPVSFAGGSIDQDGRVVTSGEYMLASFVRWGRSDRYKGRGRSILDRKIDSFDALDEVWSQWMDALRSGRTKEYIPDVLIPRDPNTGALVKPNAFDNRFISTATDISENAKNEIKVDTPTIQHESYIASYVTALDLCLQGIISPSTLGIDVKKMDNAEAQREKEKTTLYTRQKIIAILGKTLPDLVSIALKAYADMTNDTIEDVTATLNFGEYANPSFESQIETVAKGKQGGIMSVEAAVDELYGDTKDEEWKKEEIRRIKDQQGIAQMEDPSVNMSLGDFDVDLEE